MRASAAIFCIPLARAGAAGHGTGSVRRKGAVEESAGVVSSIMQTPLGAEHQTKEGRAIYIQVVTYSLIGITHDEYLRVADALAPRFAAIPGLREKMWLATPGANRYGAIYLWDEQEAMESFLLSGLFEGSSPGFSDVVSQGFSVLSSLATRDTSVVDNTASNEASGPAKAKGTKAAGSASKKATNARARTREAGAPWES